MNDTYLMTEVLSMHSVAGLSGGTHTACRCDRKWVLHAEYRTHLADELTKAGYGKVRT